MSKQTFRIHGPRGIIERAFEAIVERTREPTRTNAHQVSVTEIMSRQVICALQDLSLGILVEVMLRDRLGCVPIIDERGCPLGMVTKFDIVEHLASPRRLETAVVAEVMMPMAITLEQNATVAHAAALMATEEMHHVIIVAERRLVGLVSTMDVTRWLADEYEGTR